MGNGESTSRRISMQRSDEGTIQISENVMNRLSNVKPPKDENEVLLNSGESVIHEEQLKRMLEKAFHQGQSTAISRLQAEQEKVAEEMQNCHEKEEVRHKEQLQQLAEYWKTEFERETSKVKELSQQDSYAVQSLQEMLSKQEIVLSVKEGQLDEEKTQLYEEKNKIVEEKCQLDAVKSILDVEKSKLEEERHKVVEEKMTLDESRKLLEEVNKVKERDLQAEFDKGVKIIDSQIKPLQHSPICTEIQSKVLQCYRENKKQPMKCANEVQEFIQCVHAARVKLMQAKLYDRE